VFVLDANDPENPDQSAWLQGALAASSATWKIVVFHQPAYSCAEHDGDPRVEELWAPIFQQAGVQLVLNGHDHDYQRFGPVGPTTYVVTGGGGAGLYPLDACPADYPAQVAGDDEHHHFVTVQEEGAQLRVQAISDTGQVIDEFLLAQTGGA
jgi:acid phosphatase